MRTFAEDDLLPLSALQHLLFCPRQCALIHLEQAWDENRFTAEGRLAHDRVHEETTEIRDGIVVTRGLRLVSRRLGLSGKADVVEFHPLPEGDAGGTALPQRPGRWRPYPVEHKRGRAKKSAEDRVQLCAQALCLEEMLGADVPEGALFYGKKRRRKTVDLDAALRKRTEEAARRLHQMMASGRTPSPEFGPKCESCSLRERCMPEAPGGGSASSYVEAYRNTCIREETG